MENNIICPLLSAASDYFITCKGERCAWWHYSACDCCLVSLTDTLMDISTSMEELVAGKDGDTDE